MSEDLMLTRRELRLARERAELTASGIDSDDAVTDAVVRDSAEGREGQPEVDASSTTTTRGKRERGLLGYILNGLLAAVLIAILGVGVAAIVVPAATGSTALTVMTSSMEPNLPPGTLVVVHPTPPVDIREGMVLTYQLRSGDPTLVTHRVVERYQLVDGGYEWVTQGDNNPTPDPDRVREVQAKGTVWYALPYLGWVSAGITGPWRVWLIPIVVCGLFAYAVVMVLGALRDRRQTASASS